MGNAKFFSFSEHSEEFLQSLEKYKQYLKVIKKNNELLIIKKLTKLMNINKEM